jgi:hypothetical protein
MEDDSSTEAQASLELSLALGNSVLTDAPSMTPRELIGEAWSILRVLLRYSARSRLLLARERYP